MDEKNRYLTDYVSPWKKFFPNKLHCIGIHFISFVYKKAIEHLSVYASL